MKKFKQKDFLLSLLLLGPLFAFCGEGHSAETKPELREYASYSLESNNKSEFVVTVLSSNEYDYFSLKTNVNGKEVFKSNDKSEIGIAIGTTSVYELIERDWNEAYKKTKAPAENRDAEKQKFCTQITKKLLEAEEGKSLDEKKAAFGKKVIQQGRGGYFSCEKTSYAQLGIPFDDKAIILNP